MFVSYRWWSTSPILVLNDTAGYTCFTVDELEAGYYHVIFKVIVDIRRQLIGPNAKSQRAELGVLRVAAGSPSDKFFENGRSQDDAMLFTMLVTGTHKEGQLPPARGTYKIELEEDVQCTGDQLAFILQWTGGHVYASPEDSVALSIRQLR